MAKEVSRVPGEHSTARWSYRITGQSIRVTKSAADALSLRSRPAKPRSAVVAELSGAVEPEQGLVTPTLGEGSGKVGRCEK